MPQSIDKIAVLEKDSPIIKLYDVDTLELTDCLSGHKGAVLRCVCVRACDCLRCLLCFTAFAEMHYTAYSVSDSYTRAVYHRCLSLSLSLFITGACISKAQTT